MQCSALQKRPKAYKEDLSQRVNACFNITGNEEISKEGLCFVRFLQIFFFLVIGRWGVGGDWRWKQEYSVGTSQTG